MVAALGAALVSAGSRIAGPAATKSMGGKMLKTGGFAPTKGEIKIANLLQVGNSIFKNVNKNVSHIASILSASSPAFKQQMIILNKSVQLLIRPIGDIMAKFVRPMAVWMMKFARKWYDLFGGGSSGGEQTKSEVQDALETAKEQRTAAVETYGEGSPEVKKIDQDISRLEAQLKSGSEGITNLFDVFNTALINIKEIGKEIWDNFIPEAAKVLWESMKETWWALVEVMQELWNILKPILEPLWELVKVIGGAVLGAALLVLIGAFKVLTGALKLVMFTLKGLKIVLTIAWEWLVKLNDIIGDAITWAFEKLWDILKSVGTFLKDVFLSVWDDLSNAFSKVVDWIKKIISWVKSLPFMGGSDGNTETANDVIITKSGRVIKTHPDDTIMASKNGFEGMGTGGNSTTNIYLNANINNEMDIRDLARKLAEYYEVEQRRRSSYGGY